MGQGRRDQGPVPNDTQRRVFPPQFRPAGRGRFVLGFGEGPSPAHEIGRDHLLGTQLTNDHTVEAALNRGKSEPITSTMSKGRPAMRETNRRKQRAPPRRSGRPSRPDGRRGPSSPPPKVPPDRWLPFRSFVRPRVLGEPNPARLGVERFDGPDVEDVGQRDHPFRAALQP